MPILRQHKCIFFIFVRLLSCIIVPVFPFSLLFRLLVASFAIVVLVYSHTRHILPFITTKEKIEIKMTLVGRHRNEQISDILPSLRLITSPTMFAECKRTPTEHSHYDHARGLVKRARKIRRHYYIATAI